jgi:hypothetical protein
MAAPNRSGDDRHYIDPPTIPAGLTIATYRKLREHQRSSLVRGIRRVSSRAMTIGRS